MVKWLLRWDVGDGRVVEVAVGRGVWVWAGGWGSRSGRPGGACGCWRWRVG